MTSLSQFDAVVSPISLAMEVDNHGIRQWHKRPQDERSPAPATPMPTKRGKSEEKDTDNTGPLQQPTFEPEIRDLVDTMRDMQDVLKTQNNQIAFLLFKSKSNARNARPRFLSRTSGSMRTPLTLFFSRTTASS